MSGGGSFGSPLTAGPDTVAPGPPIFPDSNHPAPTAVAGNSGFLDVSSFEGLVISANTGIGAGATITFTFEWFDVSLINVMSAGGFFPTVLQVAGGAGSLNGVRVRNLGPFLRVSWSASGGPAPTIFVWGSNHQFDHDGAYCGSMQGVVLRRFSYAAGGSSVVTYGGVGANVAQQYCGPALVSVRHTVSGAGTIAWCDIRDAAGLTIQSTIVQSPVLGITQRIWIPPEPFQIFAGAIAQPADIAVVAGW